MTRTDSTSAILLWLLTPILGLLGGCGQPSSEPPPSRAPSPVAAASVPRPKSGAEMVLIPAGEFTMGDEQGEDDEQPAHRVRRECLPDGRDGGDSGLVPGADGPQSRKFAAPDKPVERISWPAAIRYWQYAVPTRRPAAVL